MVFVLILLFAAASYADAVFSGSISISGDVVGISGELSAPNKAASLSPADDSTHISIEPTLSWSNGGGATAYDVYFDTVNPPLTKVVDAAAQLSYEPATLEYNTVYYWRVDPKNNVGTTTGDVFSFTTIPTFDANLLVDFETDSAGTLLTSTVMTNASNGDIGSWTVSANGQIYGEVSSEEQALWSPFVVGGVTYVDDSGTRGVRFRLDQTSNYIRLDPTNLNSISISAWFKMDDDVAGTQIDLIHIRSVLGGFFVAQTHGEHLLRSHAGGEFGSQFGTDINFQFGVWYRLMVHAVRNGVSTVRLYNTDGTQLGSDSTLTPWPDSEWSLVDVGRTDAHAVGETPSTAWVYFDDIAVDVADATFPLGP